MQEIPDLSKLPEAELTDEQRAALEAVSQPPEHEPQLSDFSSAKVHTIKGTSHEFAPFFWQLDDKFLIGQPTNGTRDRMMMIPLTSILHITVTNVAPVEEKAEDGNEDS